MKDVFLGGALLLAASSALAQQTGPSLIVRVDDMGSFHSANKACIDGFRNGIETSVELMVVTPWFPEAVKMLNENPGLDVGLHLVITSEWENMKWRPLTHCPSLTDKNGYFYPMMGPNPAYPGQSIKENGWSLDEIEQEFRAQIELALKNVPRISHLTGHMYSTAFAPEVSDMVSRLAEEYNLPAIDNASASELYGITYVFYDGEKETSAQKEASFLRMLDKLESGKRYVFLDHPAYNDSEMETVGHIGYEDVAIDRQGVTDVLTSDKVKQAIAEKDIKLISFNQLTKSLPRESSPKMDKAMARYLEAVEKEGEELHSIMVLQHGKVIGEKWLNGGNPDTPHVLNSVSKTFTSLAVGFAIAEGKLSLTDKVASFFPDEVPGNPNENVQALEVRHLLTMSSGHATDPTRRILRRENPGMEGNEPNWAREFFAAPIEEQPGTRHVYNSLGTYMLSAIVQKVTGEKVIDYLYPRLFRPLGITGAMWDESPQNINAGGWGLYLKTEDLAKVGQFLLQKGEWHGKQLLPASWVEEASSSQIASYPSDTPKEKYSEMKQGDKNSDWLQGYGYQMWRCRHNAYRADGANGQFIIVIPDRDAVIAMTADIPDIPDMQAELNLVWKHIYPALK